MSRICVSIIFLLLLTPVLADGSIAHFHDASGQHGVFRKDDRGLVLYLHSQKEEWSPKPVESFVLTSKQVLEIETELYRFAPELRANQGNREVKVYGDLERLDYRFTLYVDKERLVPVLRAVQKALSAVGRVEAK